MVEYFLDSRDVAVVVVVYCYCYCYYKLFDDISKAAEQTLYNESAVVVAVDVVDVDYYMHVVVEGVDSVGDYGFVEGVGSGLDGCSGGVVVGRRRWKGSWLVGCYWLLVFGRSDPIDLD